MRKKQLLTTLVKATFLALVFYFCLQFLVPYWTALQLSDRVTTLSVSWIVAAGIFTLGYYGLGFLIWRTILLNLGSQPNPRMITRAYMVSLLAKYIPGNVAAHGLRTRLAFKAGVPVVVSMKSFLLEAVFAVGTAVVISVIGTMYYFPEIIGHFSTLAVVAFTLVLITALAVRGYKLSSIDTLRLSAASTSYVNVFVFYILVWFFSGVAHWCLANAFGQYSVSQLPQLMVAVSASWALGFVSIFAPAGLGVREAVLYFFVSNWMEQADVILFVTLSRLLMFGVEVLLTLGCLLYIKLAHERRPQ